MSTVKTTNITHGSNSGTANIILASDGKVTIPEKKLASPGTIIQVKQTYLSTHESFSVSNNTVSEYTTSDKLVVAITPTAASSKILVTGNLNVGLSSQNLIYIALRRSIDGNTATNIGGSSDAGNRFSGITSTRMDELNDIKTVNVNYLDSPNTTDEVKYFYAFAHSSGSSKTLYINTGHSQAGSSNDSYSYGRTGSTITVMEVAG